MSVLDILQIAHEIGVPHQDPAPTSDSGGGASPIVIGLGVLLSLACVAALVWLKKRTG